jgi:hypothetical protein
MKMHRRDLIILPVVSLLTVIGLWAGAESLCRVIWPEQDEDPCMAFDPVIGYHARPGCTTLTKAAEGPWVEENWTSCGTRAPAVCERRDSHAARVVTMGTSTSWGSLVPLHQTWFMRAASELRSRCGRGFEVQATGGTPDLYESAARLPSILQLRPDAVVMVVTPFDLATRTSDSFSAVLVGNPRAEVPTLQRRREQLRELVTSSRALLIVEHLLYQNADLYVSNYLLGGDRVDYLRQPFSPMWRKRFEFVDAAFGYMADQLQSAGVPFLVILAPHEAQAELAAGASRPPNVDPFALGATLADIAARHHIRFVDATRSYAGVEEPQSTYYRVNGHFNAAGHAILGSVAAEALAAVADSDGKPLCDTEAMTVEE